MTDSLWDPTVKGDADLARLEAALAPLRHRAPLRDLPPRRRRPRWPLAAGAVIAAAAAVLLLVRRGAEPSPCSRAAADAFRFESLAGAARCGGADVAAGWLPAGVPLETGAGDRARVVVADIGAVEVAERSRLSLVATGPEEHRMALDVGAIHAKVTAPPRLFVIETPEATAIDLGCEYDLVVAADGSGHLRVTQGKVELAEGARVVHVPMGAEARILAGRGPGTPVRSDAPAELRAAVDRFDGGDASALDAILRIAGVRDTVTLWNLLGAVGPEDRGRLYDLIDGLVGTPETVLKEACVAGDREALDRIREALEGYWLVPEMLPDAPETWAP